MRQPLRENALVVAGATASLCVMLWLGVHGWSWPDWQMEARPAVGALLAGHVSQFLRVAPIYGGSLILRAPFILFTKLWGGGELSIYVAGALPCLIALGALAVWLTARMRTLGRSRGARALLLVLCVANPLMLPALQLGHPEDLLGAALCIAAVLCAMDDRPIWAAVLLGAAIPNKEWAVLALGPVLVALRHGRLRALVIAGAIATLLLAPFALVPLVIGTSGGVAASVAANGLNTGAIFQPWQIWWFFGTHADLAKGLSGSVRAGYRTPPGWLGSLGHPLIIALMPPLSLLYTRLHRVPARRPVNPALLLLTLVLALRCVLDPWDISYYSVPFLLALSTWESLSFDRPPVLALMAAFTAWLIFQRMSAATADIQALAFAVISVPAVVAMAVALYRPRVSQLRAPSRDASVLAPWQPGLTQKSSLRT